MPAAVEGAHGGEAATHQAEPGVHRLEVLLNQQPACARWSQHQESGRGVARGWELGQAGWAGGGAQRTGCPQTSVAGPARRRPSPSDLHRSLGQGPALLLNLRACALRMPDSRRARCAVQLPSRAFKVLLDAHPPGFHPAAERKPAPDGHMLALHDHPAQQHSGGHAHGERVGVWSCACCRVVRGKQRSS